MRFFSFLDESYIPQLFTKKFSPREPKYLNGVAVMDWDGLTAREIAPIGAISRLCQQLNQSGSCSRCGGQRCGPCKIGILAETKKFCSLTVRFKYRTFRSLNCISVNAIYKMDCTLGKLGLHRSKHV